MTWGRGWIGAVCAVALLTACTPGSGQGGSLPPVGTGTTAAATSTSALSATDVPTPSATTSSTTAPVVTESPSTPPVPIGDKSVAAAAATAKVAVGVFIDVTQSMSLTALKAITTPECPCRQQYITARALLLQQNAHVVGHLPTDIRTTVVSHAGDVVKVRVNYTVPAHKSVTSTGKVLQALPSYPAADIFQMNYIARRWLVYFVELAP